MIKIRFLLTFLLCFFVANYAFAVKTGKVEYVVPFDYSLIDEASINSEAESLFNDYLKTENEEEKVKLLTVLLQKYSILTLVNLDNPLYFVRLGIIYGNLGNDRYALMNFYRGSNLDGKYPYAFSSFGEYYFLRSEFKKALRMYKRAYDCGYNVDYETVYHLGIIYEKYGDFTTAIKYYKEALALKQSEELKNKINILEELLAKNSIYNMERGIKN